MKRTLAWSLLAALLAAMIGFVLLSPIEISDPSPARPAATSPGTER